MIRRIDFPSSKELLTAAVEVQAWLAERRVASAVVGALGLQWYGLDRLTAHVDLLAAKRVTLPAHLGGGHVICHGPPAEGDFRPLARDAIRDAVHRRWNGGTARIATLGHLVTLRMAFAPGRRRHLAAEDVKTIVWGHKSPPRKPREVKAVRAVVKAYLGEFGASRFDDLCLEGELEFRRGGGRR